jgi:single-stranded DNA-binding protein
MLVKNHVEIVGRFAREPKFTLAKDPNNNRVFFTLCADRAKKEWGYDAINCVAWGALADEVLNKFKKGYEAEVTGHIHTDNKLNEDGTYSNFWNVTVEKIELKSVPKLQTAPAATEEHDQKLEAAAALNF